MHYKCAACNGNFVAKDIQADHINPVVDPKVGFVDWDTYIKRMFVEVDGYQVLCSSCHDAKTKTERDLRKEFKNAIDD